MFGIPEDHFDDHFPTTTQDLCRHQAYHVGRERPEQAWILSSWDTWERNPFYEGPEEPHPEDYPHEEDEDVVAVGSNDDEEEDGLGEEVPF